MAASSEDRLPVRADATDITQPGEGYGTLDNFIAVSNTFIQ